MNRELKRVSVFVLLLFLALFVSTTVIQAVQADALNADPRNTRTLYESYQVERGPILVAGTPIASSAPSNDVYKWQRTYTNGPLYAPVTGFFPVNGEPTGIEGSFNDYLSGTANSQFLTSLERIFTGQKPKGAAVEVSIDPVAQQAAWDALGDYTGAVVLTEPSTGRILALVSKPTFDPNSLAGHDTDAVDVTYDALVADPTDPLIDRNRGGDLNPPGSTFKLVVAAAAFESGKYTPESTFPNLSEYQLPGSTSVVINSGGGTCGPGATVSIADAVRLSCNIPMAELGVELGDKAIRDQAEKFGFNVEHHIPMTVEKSVYPAVLDDAQTALSAFGQYEVRATPIQMAMVSAGIANGGIVMEPSLADQITGTDLSVVKSFDPVEFGRAISTETADALKKMMVADVDDGAASNARIDGVSVGGKTGTAENIGADGEEDPYTLWFTGFAPAEDTQFAITVLIEDGGGMGTDGYGNLLAAPVAQKVLEAVLNK
ncbi:peptidoglycan D,D-transpeptidase FtsI family protein [Leifsonia sp. Leaf264]|uniref:peptidoglycan D,D-transpeptidase FtsI family protein n=1 Tax=Leifsonia sp. Leaf264 TaxID=1736314 RepID=UPI0006FFAE8A|nr:penicillin-binding protein 2 [Leifsonia sp. Leaf264]KQO95722.1 cell division protein FtsI [Leifsonia sp. Leaf264]